MAILSWLFKNKDDINNSNSSSNSTIENNDDDNDIIDLYIDNNNNNNIELDTDINNNNKNNIIEQEHQQQQQQHSSDDDDEQNNNNNSDDEYFKQMKLIASNNIINDSPYYINKLLSEQQQLYNLYFDNSFDRIKNKRILQKDNSKVQTEIVFSFDSTGTMIKYFNSFKQDAQQIFSICFKKLPLLKIAIIVHGDYYDDNSSNNNSDSGKTLTILDFTNDVNEIKKFLDTIKKTNGGDAPECYEYVLRKARELPWSFNSKKSLIIIGDDVPHPPSYTDQFYYWRNELHFLSKIDVRVYGVQCFNNKHAQLFYEELASLSSGRYVHLEDHRDIGYLVLLIILRENGTDILNNYIKNTLDKEKRKLFREKFHQLFEDYFIRERDSTSNIRFSWWDISFDVNTNPKYIWNQERNIFIENPTIVNTQQQQYQQSILNNSHNSSSMIFNNHHQQQLFSSPTTRNINNSFRNNGNIPFSPMMMNFSNNNNNFDNDNQIHRYHNLYSSITSPQKSTLYNQSVLLSSVKKSTNNNLNSINSTPFKSPFTNNHNHSNKSNNRNNFTSDSSDEEYVFNVGKRKITNGHVKTNSPLKKQKEQQQQQQQLSLNDLNNDKTKNNSNIVMNNNVIRPSHHSNNNNTNLMSKFIKEFNHNSSDTSKSKNNSNEIIANKFTLVNNNNNNNKDTSINLLEKIDKTKQLQLNDNKEISSEAYNLLVDGPITTTLTNSQGNILTTTTTTTTTKTKTTTTTSTLSPSSQRKNINSNNNGGDDHHDDDNSTTIENNENPLISVIDNLSLPIPNKNTSAATAVVENEL